MAVRIKFNWTGRAQQLLVSSNWQGTGLALEAVYPESWLFDAKAVLDLGKLGLSASKLALSSSRGSLQVL